MNVEEALHYALKAREIAKKHNKFFEESIPLIASENLISPLARELLLTDFHNRYAEGLPGKRYYQGNMYVDEIEILATELSKMLFNAKYADVRPISGTNANQAVIFAFTKPGDIIMGPSLQSGGHISSAEFGSVGFRGLNKIEYPFDIENMTIDVDLADKMIRIIRPKLALFGKSVFPFPEPIKELKDALTEAESIVWYDGAHVLGLIGGGKFQDPLREGAHVITGSTHKTLPGPQRGIILADNMDEKTWNKVQRGVFPGVISNHHLHHLAALVVTLAEHIAFGKEYAEQVIRNAKALAQALHDRGFKVLGESRGFTESHVVLVDVSAQGGGRKAAENLEKANIICNFNLLPYDDPKKPMNPSGIRLGSQECTRLGMKEGEMEIIADFIKRVVMEEEPPERVREDVIEFKRNYTKVHYCFGEFENIYKYIEMVKI